MPVPGYSPLAVDGPPPRHSGRNAAGRRPRVAHASTVPVRERRTATLSLRSSTRRPFLLPRVDRSGATRPNTPSERLLADVAGVGALGLPSDIEINLDSDERLLG